MIFSTTLERIGEEFDVKSWVMWSFSLKFRMKFRAFESKSTRTSPIWRVWPSNFGKTLFMSIRIDFCCLGLKSVLNWKSCQIFHEFRQRALTKFDEAFSIFHGFKRDFQNNDLRSMNIFSYKKQNLWLQTQFDFSRYRRVTDFRISIFHIRFICGSNWAE